jgi:hypothetical protein
MNYLIDPNGNWWRWPSANLAERLGYPDPDFDMPSYAARNLGYVWLLVQPNVTFLQFRAGMLSRFCLDSLKPYLRKAVKDKPVALVFYASGWLEEAYVDPEPLLARIDELAFLREPRMREKIIHKNLLISDWQIRQQNSMLASLFGLWRSEGGRFSAKVAEYLQETGLSQRTLLLTRNDQTKDLHVIQSGNGFSVYDDYSYSSSVGRNLLDQPDRNYALWAAGFYNAAMDDGDPLIGDVDAIVEQSGHDDRRRRYQRLILRWQNGDGSMLLSGSSILNPLYLSIPLDVSRV